MTDQQNGPAELREALERATARADAAEQELRSLKTEVVFDKAQVPMAAAALYQGEDLTVEAVVEWANAHAIQVGSQGEPVEAKQAEVEGTVDIPEGGRAPAVERITADGPSGDQSALAQIGAAAGSQRATAGQALPTKMSHQEFAAMMANPATQDAATQAYLEGRVERHPGNVQADQLQAKGIIR